MKSRLRIILQLLVTALVAIGFQDCDSTGNIDKPTAFIKYIGGHGNQTGVDMVIDAEGSVYILGSTTSIDSAQQIYVVKTNLEGNVIWEQIFGGAGDEAPKDIEVMSDGNLAIVADVTEDHERDFVIYLLTAAEGTQIMKGKGGTNGKPDYANSITQTTDGFIVASYIDEGAFKTGWVRRFHQDLVEFGGEWTSDINQFDGASGHDVVPVKIFQASPSVFYTFGYTNSTADNGGPDYNVLITATNNLNSLIRVFVPKGISASSDERVTSVSKVPGGAGFVISGYSTNGGAQELFMLRVVGSLETPTTTADIISVPPKDISSGLSNASSSWASTSPSTSSGFLVLGERNSTGNSDLYLTKVDNTIAAAWPDPGAQVFGGVGNDLAGAVAEAGDGTILVCGTMVLGDALGQQKIVLMRLNREGMLGK